MRAAAVLPHTWQVTSDRVAAFVPEALDAERLILVKPAAGARQPSVRASDPCCLRGFATPFCRGTASVSWLSSRVRRPDRSAGLGLGRADPSREGSGSRAAAGEELGQTIGRHRSAEEIPLHFVTALPSQ